MSKDQMEPDISVKQLQDLLRESRCYVYHADVPDESAYDDQQEMLRKIDELAPPVLEPKPIFQPCEKDPSCVLAKGHEGNCDDIPY